MRRAFNRIAENGGVGVYISSVFGGWAVIYCDRCEQARNSPCRH
jgi:hypothetical protein